MTPLSSTGTGVYEVNIIGGYRSLCAILLAGVIGILGCQASIDRPTFDPQWSSAKALEQCDTNGDGLIDQSEASAAPGLLRAFALWDLNSDKMISGEEVAERISSYRASAGSVASAAFNVTYKRKPLSGAEVTLEPEPFMGEGFAPVTATTDQTGFVALNRPNMEEDGYPGVYLGVYRVRISKQENGQEVLPSKYNSESELGFDSGGQSRRARFSHRFDLE